MAAAFGDLPHVYSVTTSKHHHYVPTVCSSTEIKTTRGSPFRRGTEIKTTRGSPFRRGTEIKTTRGSPFRRGTEIKTTRGSPFRRGTEIKTTRGSPFRRGTESRSAPILQLFGCGCPVCLRLSEDWL